MQKTPSIVPLIAVSIALFAAGATYGQETAPKAPTRGVWNATGTLLESCTCAVPCTCNFGEGPSPNSYCHAVFGYRLEKASWDGVDLSGLIVAGADGPNGAAGFLDARATPTQRPALEKMGRALFAQGGPSSGPRTFIPVSIVHTIQGNDLKLDIPGHGGFSAKLIMGRDGHTPVVVENNTTWPVLRAMKGKASSLAFNDTAAGKIATQGNNANYGAFRFEGRTTGTIATASATAGCCEKPKRR